jgi:hypothetical protein
MLSLNQIKKPKNIAKEQQQQKSTVEGQETNLAPELVRLRQLERFNRLAISP